MEESQSEHAGQVVLSRLQTLSQQSNDPNPMSRL